MSGIWEVYLWRVTGKNIRNNSGNCHIAYNTMQVMLEKCGIEEANNNACHPSTSMIFVGVLFNTQSMTIKITAERLKEIISLLTSWLNKEKASLKEIQSLLGKLNFIAACVRPGRVFISRMLPSVVECVIQRRCKFVVCLAMCHFVLVIFSPFRIAITSLGEERANLSAFRTFVRFVPVWIC